MKITSLLSAFFLVVLLSSCSRYQEDVVYSQRLDVKAQTPNQTLAVTPMQPVHAMAVASQPKASFMAQTVTEFKARVSKAKTSKVASTVGHAFAAPLMLASVTAKHKAPFVKNQEVQPGNGATPGKGAFLMLLSALAVVSAAILMFTGFSTGQTIIAIAGVVLFVIGVVVFGMAAATVASRQK